MLVATGAGRKTGARISILSGAATAPEFRAGLADVALQDLAVLHPDIFLRIFHFAEGFGSESAHCLVEFEN